MAILLASVVMVSDWHTLHTSFDQYYFPIEVLDSKLSYFERVRIKVVEMLELELHF